MDEADSVINVGVGLPSTADRIERFWNGKRLHK